MTRLCRTHRLHSALAFLFTRALSDYAAPAAELLLAHAHAPADERPPAAADGHAPALVPAWGRKRATGYKLLVYLRCCFAGRAFPPGVMLARASRPANGRPVLLPMCAWYVC